MRDVVIVDYIDKLAPACGEMSRAVDAAMQSLRALGPLFTEQDDVKRGDLVVLYDSPRLYRVIALPGSAWEENYIVEQFDDKDYVFTCRRDQFRVVTPLEALGRAIV